MSDCMVSTAERSSQMDQPVKKATLLVNFAARGVKSDFNAPGAVAYLRRMGVDAVLASPGSSAEATQAARESALRGDDLLFVVGGDGSLRDAADGLAGSSTALAAVRGGTANVWAKEVGIPRGARAAINSHLSGQRVRMDMGRAGPHPFLLMAGIGFDAAVTRAVPRGLKRRLGPFAYVLQGMTMPGAMRPQVTRWLAGGTGHEAAVIAIIIGNTRLYGGLVELTPDATANDGMLDLCAICPRRLTDTLRMASKIAMHRFNADPSTIRSRVDEVLIETPGLAVQLDGDFVAETPLHFTVERDALLVSIPEGPLPAIFSAGAASQ
jgi:diacylglycerol kinase (ATP)